MPDSWPCMGGGSEQNTSSYTNQDVVSHGYSINPRKVSHWQFTPVWMHPRPDDITQGKKSNGDGDPVSLAGLEHRLCPILIERNSRNDGASLFSRNLREGLSTDQSALAGLEVDGSCRAAETTGILGHALLDGTWEGVRRGDLRTPALAPLLIEHFLQILHGVLTSQEGKELVSELVESHPVSEEMSRANEQIEIALCRLIIVGRGWRRVGRGNRVAGGQDEVRNSLIGQCPGSIEIGVNEL